MFGTFLQLREGGQGIPRLGIARVVHFYQHRTIALHDQWIGGIVLHALPQDGEPVFAAQVGPRAEREELRRKWQCSRLTKCVQGEKNRGQESGVKSSDS